MARLPFHIGSVLTVETRAGTVAGSRRMELLAQIAAKRSIAAAARETGITYKAAWDAVDTMNNLAGVPLVTRTVGGRGGGGATLTTRGRELLASFQAVARENEKFLQSVNRRTAACNGDAGALRRLAFATSARNQLAGTVRRIGKGAINDLVELVLPGGGHVSASITCESTATLGLEPGSEAIALIKASWIIIAADAGPALRHSARNRLPGVVRRVTKGAAHSEVVIDLDTGGSVAATVTTASVRALKLARGRRASAIFKASSVILAVAR